MKKPSHRKPGRPHSARQTRRERHPSPQAGPTHGVGYVARLLAAQARGGLAAPGTVTTVTVAHDDGCRRPHGGPCACTPDIDAFTADGRVLTIDGDGDVVASRRPH